jgi:hypothetical protein
MRPYTRFIQNEEISEKDEISLKLIKEIIKLYTKSKDVLSILTIQNYRSFNGLILRNVFFLIFILGFFNNSNIRISYFY